MTTELLKQYIGTRFAEGGRTRAEGMDCLGVVLLVLAELSFPPHAMLDPWGFVRERWHAGDAGRAVLAHGAFPDGWRRATSVPVLPPSDGSVALMPSGEPSAAVPPDATVGHVGVVHCGTLYSASKARGVYAVPWHRIRVRVLELWEWNPQ